MEYCHLIMKYEKKNAPKKIILTLMGFEPVITQIKGKRSIHYTTNTALSLLIVHSILTTIPTIW